MTTKQQEREALAKIQKIIAGLGEGSYIGTALEGCLEIAEQNIENDWACSMKQRVDSAENQIAVLQVDRDAWKATAEGLQENVNKLQDEVLRVRSLWEDDQKKLPPVKLYNAIWEIMFDQEEIIQANMERNAGTMADLADTPKDIAFQHAVSSYKKNRELLKTVRWVQEELDKINPGR